MNLKKIGKVLTSKSVGTGPSSYEKRIYRAAVSQNLRNTGLSEHPRAIIYVLMVHVLYTVNTLNLSYITPLFTIALRQWITSPLVSISHVIIVSKCSVCLSLTIMYCKLPLCAVNYSEGGFSTQYYKPVTVIMGFMYWCFLRCIPPPMSLLFSYYVDRCGPQIYISRFITPLFVDLPGFRQLQFTVLHSP